MLEHEWLIGWELDFISDLARTTNLEQKRCAWVSQKQAEKVREIRNRIDKEKGREKE